MTFSAFEESRALGSPTNLYLFRYGPNAADVFCYCDAEYNVNFGSNTYIAAPIERDTIKAKTTLDKSELEIRMPQNTDLAELFRYYPPSEVITLTIYQGHADDPDQQWIVAWSGRVLGFEIDGNEAKYTCEPISSSMRRPGLRRHYGYGCPHRLYGTECGANKAAATRSVTVAELFSNALALPDTWESSLRKIKYVGGMVEWTGNGRTERRTILDVQNNGNTLLLSGPVRGLAVGSTVSVVLGCNHKMEDCSEIHNNIVNFGGQPYIPMKNPVGLRNNFY